MVDGTLNMILSEYKDKTIRQLCNEYVWWVKAGIDLREQMGSGFSPTETTRDRIHTVLEHRLDIDPDELRAILNDLPQRIGVDFDNFRNWDATAKRYGKKLYDLLCKQGTELARKPY